MKKKYTVKTLSNGIKVYFYSSKDCKRTYVSYNIKYGTLGYFDKFYYKDKPYHMMPAMAHFLEHYLIEKCKMGNMLHHFKDKNYEFNGLTYYEVTSFYFLGINDIKESLKELIYMVDKPVFKEKDVDEVKSAIIEELKNEKDNKYKIAFANNKNNTFKSFDAVPVDNNILGSIETTSSITLNDVKTAYAAYYNNENKFLVIGGNVNINEYMEYLEDIYKDIEYHPNERKDFDYPASFDVKKPLEIIPYRTDSDFTIVTYKVPELKMDKLKLESYIYLYNMLKFNSATPLVENLVKENVVVGEIGYSIDFFKGAVAITYDANTFNSEKFLKAIDDNLNLDNLDEKEFELVKRGAIVNELKQKDYIYTCFKSFPTYIDFTTDFLNVDVFNSLTLDELKEVISKISFNLKTVTIMRRNGNE